MRCLLPPATAAVAVAAILCGARPAAGQTAQAPPDAAMLEVRETLAEARKAIDAYRSAGGKTGVPDHPAVRWHEMLWRYRERQPGSAAAAVATSEAINLLIRAGLPDAAHARVAALSRDDTAWERLAAYLYYEAVDRKDFAYAVGKLSEVASGTSSAPIKAAALVALGRAYRRQGDGPSAVTSLEAAQAAAPEAPTAREAASLLYDIANLSIGLTAPAFSGATRDGRRITLDSLRGSAVVLVFWSFG